MDKFSLLWHLWVSRGDSQETTEEEMEYVSKVSRKRG